MILQELNKINPHIKILDTESPQFLQYGRVIEGDFSQLIDYMSEKVEIPSEGNIYIPSDEEMEAFEIKKAIENKEYGEMSIQIGYCNGKNQYLNGLEYHKCHEINIAVTDMVLLLGRLQDIHCSRYASEKVEAFYIPKGTAVELYCTTLHLAPCMVYEDGFKCIVILQKDTNLPLYNVEEEVKDNNELFAKNKWLLVHPGFTRMVEKGAKVCIDGDNIKINHINN